MSMTEMENRHFKLSLTIAEKPEFDGAHAVLALMIDEDGTPLLGIEAGGFPCNNEGAAELADMLRDAADAIDDHLERPRPHTDTATLPAVPLPSVPKRPRFNPQPRGK